MYKLYNKLPVNGSATEKNHSTWKEGFFIFYNQSQNKYQDCFLAKTKKAKHDYKSTNRR